VKQFLLEILKGLGLITIIVLILSAPKLAKADGTGFFIDNNGHMLTNAHVVQETWDNGLKNIMVLYQGKLYAARILEVGIHQDIALLQVYLPKSSPCEQVVRDVDLAVNDILQTVIYDRRLEDNRGGFVSLAKFIIKAFVNDTQLGHIGSIVFEPLVRAGNSGSPVLNSDNDVVSIVYAGTVSQGSDDINEVHVRYVDSYSLPNKELIDFLSNKPQVAACINKASQPQDILAWVQA
jgi:S1-C subfamily serine protease